MKVASEMHCDMSQCVPLRTWKVYTHRECTGNCGYQMCTKCNRSAKVVQVWARTLTQV